MTVRNIPPIARYTGNGSEVTYAWDWDMIEDSSINVLVDNVNLFQYQDWNLQGQNVVFVTAPDDGAEIIIYRRTIPRQPEDFIAFGRFHSEKTELAMDRDILIAQERAGDSRHGEPYNGIVGGANISSTRGEFTHTIVSERGTDAVIPLWDGDDVSPPTPGSPDPTIVIWEGAEINAGIYSLPGNTSGVAATIQFRMDLTEGDPTKASAYYPNYNDFAFTSWCTVDPADDEYWMRVTLQEYLPEARYNISDGTYARSSGEAFQIRGRQLAPTDTIVDRNIVTIVNRDGGIIYPRGGEPDTSVYGPYVSVYTFGDVAPSTRLGEFTIEICKDDGNGAPDAAWAIRTVNLEARFNTETAPVPPVDITGAISWNEFFGNDFLSPISDATKVIPTEGQAIWFTVPATSAAYRVSITSIEVTGLDFLTRTGALNTTVLDFTTPPTHTWGIGGGIDAGINSAAYDIELIPGNTYILNVRNNGDPSPYANWIRMQVVRQAL